MCACLCVGGGERKKGERGRDRKEERERMDGVEEGGTGLREGREGGEGARYTDDNTEDKNMKVRREKTFPF